MKINNQSESAIIYMGNSTDRSKQANDANNENRSTRSSKNQKNTINQKNTTNVLATNLNMNQQDSVTMKKVKAQKEAMKTLLDQFTSDKKIDDDLKSRINHMSDLESEITTSQNEVKKLEDMKQQTKESFGVTDDSGEQENLELLEKQRESFKKGSKVKLTDEEKQKLSTMGPKTEYQTAILDYNAMEDVWNDKIKTASDEKIGENETIKAIKKSLLKTHPMVDAEGVADDIMDEANKEVVGMLIKEAKDHIDEEQDKNEEKVEKAKEEEKAKETKESEKKADKNDEEKTDKTSNSSNFSNSSNSSNSVSADNMDRIQKADSEQQQFQVELKNLVQKQILTVDDTKGIVVDEIL